MKNIAIKPSSKGITSGNFLENLMPQIKINQKSFRLEGIHPKQASQAAPSPEVVFRNQ